LTLTMDRVILHTVVHHSSTSTYIPYFVEIEGTFCGRMEARTKIWDRHGNGSSLFLQPQGLHRTTTSKPQWRTWPDSITKHNIGIFCTPGKQWQAVIRHKPSQWTDCEQLVWEFVLIIIIFHLTIFTFTIISNLKPPDTKNLPKLDSKSSIVSMMFSTHYSSLTKFIFCKFMTLQTRVQQPLK